MKVIVPNKTREHTELQMIDINTMYIMYLVKSFLLRIFSHAISIDQTSEFSCEK